MHAPYWTLVALLALLLPAPLSLAQCPTPATNMSIEVGACSLRLTWTPSPANTILQQVLRSTTDDPADATVLTSLVATANSFTDITASRGTWYYYWVRNLPSNPINCTAVATSSYVARVLNAGERPESITSTCNGVVITAQPRFDAVSYTFWRWSYGSGGGFVELGTTTSLTFTDTTVEPGRSYDYGVSPNGTCGPFSGASTSRVLGDGPPDVNPPLSPVIGISGRPLTISPTVAAVPNATFTWQKDGAPLPADPRFSGISSGQLTINSARWEDAGLYTVTATSPCGTDTSAPFSVTIRPGCRADFDENGAVAPTDIFSFLNTWFSGCP